MIKRPDTKTLLAESFLELANTMPMNKITISAITRNCNLRRETFYRYFLDKYELIIYTYVEYVWKNLVGLLGNLSAPEVCLFGLGFFQQNASFVKEAFKDNTQNSFTKSLVTVISNSLDELARKHYQTERLPDRSRMPIYLFVYGSVYLIRDWAEADFITPATVIADTIAEAIPPVLKELFEP